MAREESKSDAQGVQSHVTRRQALAGVGAVLGSAAVIRELPATAAVLRPAPAQGASTPAEQAEAIGPYDPSWLPDGVRSRFVHNVNGLTMHVLEAGFETEGRPALLLLHGFPELAYSWRHVMAPLADAGYHVIAPDQRGYGRTTGWSADYDGSLRPFSRLNAVRDALALVAAFGYRTVNAVIGHDFGSPVAAWSAVARPDVFRKVALMSAPFGGTPTFPFDTADDGPLSDSAGGTGHLRGDGPAVPPAPALPALLPHARGEREHVARAAGGPRLHARLLPPQERRLGGEPAVPAGGVDGDRGRQDAHLLHHGPRHGHGRDGGPRDADGGRDCRQPLAAGTAKLRVYAEEYGRNGFQGGLQWYRSGGVITDEPLTFAGRTIDVPSLFIAGSSDWGAYQRPGSLERMQESACTDMRGVHFVDGAGHWVQQEQPEQTTRLLLEFLREA